MALDLGTLRASVEFNTSRATKQARTFGRTVGQELPRNMKRSSTSMERMEKQLRDINRNTQNATKTTRTYGKTTQGTAKQTDRFNDTMFDLTKSTQLAMGPLSGVAARMTAFASLVNRNTFILAGFLGTLTGFIVGVRQTVTAGRMMEQNMMALNAALTAAGDRMDLTAEQANDLARSLGRDLLIGANGARRAITQLATFTNVAEEDFGQIIKTAQGMSVMTGNLRQNVKKLGRVLENPAENLNTLNETGVEFTEQMKDQIETLVRLGRRQEAQAIILDRLSSFQSIAEDEAKSLSGQIDTLGERFRQFFEEAAMTSGVVDNLSGVFANVNETIADTIEQGELTAKFGKAVNATAMAVAKTIEFLINNFENLTRVVVFVFASRASKALAVALTSMGGSLRAFRSAVLATSGSLGVMKTSAAAATIATRRFGLALKASPVGLITTALGAAAAAFVDFGDSVGDAVAPVESLARSVDSARRSIEDLTEAEAQLRMLNLREQVSELRDDMLETSGRISNLRESLERFSDVDPDIFDQFIRGTITFQELADSATGSLDNQRARLFQLRDAYINGSAALRTKTQALRNLQKVLSSTEIDIWSLQESLESLLGPINDSDRNISDMMNTLDEHRDRIFKEAAATREWMEQTEELNRVLIGLHQEGEITTDMMNRFLKANLALNPALEENSQAAANFQERLESVINALKTDNEKALETAANQIDVLTTAYASGRISLEDYAEQMQRVNQQLGDLKDGAGETGKEMSKFAEQAARNMQDAFADFLFDPFEDGVNSMFDKFVDVIRRMIAEWVAAQAFEGLGEALGNIGGNNNTDSASAEGGPNNNKRFPLGQMPSSMSGSLSQDQIGTLSSRGNAGVTVNVINNSGSEVRQEESTDASGNRRLDLIIDDMMAERITQGGRTTKALEQRFGNLRRSGR